MKRLTTIALCSVLALAAACGKSKKAAPAKTEAAATGSAAAGSAAATTPGQAAAAAGQAAAGELGDVELERSMRAGLDLVDERPDLGGARVHRRGQELGRGRIRGLGLGHREQGPGLIEQVPEVGGHGRTVGGVRRDRRHGRDQRSGRGVLPGGAMSTKRRMGLALALVAACGGGRSAPREPAHNQPSALDAGVDAGPDVARFGILGP